MPFLTSLRDSSGPTVAVEIAAHQVSAASLEWRGGKPFVAAHAVEPLPDGALVPSLTVANTHDRAAVVAALNRVLERTSAGPGASASSCPIWSRRCRSCGSSRCRRARPISISSSAGRCARRRRFPSRRRRSATCPGSAPRTGRSSSCRSRGATSSKNTKRLCADAGAHAGIVDLATFNVVNVVLAGSAPPLVDWLLVNVAPDYASIAILRGEHLIFFRNRAAETDGTLADLVHQTAMYYEDRLEGAGFGRVLLAGAAGAGAHQAGDIEHLRRSLEERLATPVETVDPRAAAGLTDRIVAAPALLDTLAPLVGLLLRGREVAVA